MREMIGSTERSAAGSEAMAKKIAATNPRHRVRTGAG
jgi:hypothetical protein